MTVQLGGALAYSFVVYAHSVLDRYIVYLNSCRFEILAKIVLAPTTKVGQEFVVDLFFSTSSPPLTLEPLSGGVCCIVSLPSMDKVTTCSARRRQTWLCVPGPKALLVPRVTA